MFGFLRFILFTLMIFLFPVRPIIDSSGNIAADFFLSLSRQFSKPYLWTRATASKLYIPFHNNQKGQGTTTFHELVQRGLWGELLLFTYPIALSAGPLAPFPRYMSYALRDTPYHHIVGNGTSPAKSESFTIMNFNICFLPGELPLFFGGVASPSERVEGIAKLIKEQDPDIVCLYEAHEVDSTYSLYEQLRDTYKHFYIDIGPEPFEFNSGLFVASKYDIIDPHFKPFMYEEMQEQINKGYFEFKVVQNNEILAHIYTTHLQPYRKKVDAEIREKELKEIIQDIENEYEEKPSYPIVLVGDLNISWGSSEKATSSLSEYFYSDYTQNVEHVNAKNRTATDYLTDLLWNNVDQALLEKNGPSPYYDIVDYALIFNKGTDVDIETTRIEAYSEDMSSEALSDHHALFSRIRPL